MTLKYRPEIDGLRAIAVMAVLIYHVKFFIGDTQFLSGGYIGVDIFFVISGYLISSIILKEIQNNKFSFQNFYERRARRILPALLTVMLASLPFAWIYMLPQEMKEYAGSILSSLAFVSNFWFWQEDSYWAAPSALKPFLHTWSLSVEEQFYIFFPIFMIIAWKYCRAYLIHLIMAVFILSLLLAGFNIIGGQDFAFYLLPARAWELFAGAILAYYTLQKPQRLEKSYTHIFPKIGLFLILGSFFFFDEKTDHPSFLTLIPVIGTMMLIWFCQKGEIVSNVLSSKIFVGVGLISYSLYLWHFPIIAFSLLINSEPTLMLKIGWMIASFVGAIATYYFIEQPFRNKKRISLRLFSVLMGAVLLFLIAVNMFIYKSNGLADRQNEFNQKIVTDYWMHIENREKFWTYKGCWWNEDYFSENSAPFAECLSHEKPFTPPKIMLIGDSNLAGLVPGLIETYGRTSIIQRIVTGCLPVIFEKDRKICQIGIAKAFEDIETLKPDLIILGGRYMTQKHFDLMENTFDQYLKDYKDKIAILGPLPRWGMRNTREYMVPKLRDLNHAGKIDLSQGALYLEPDDFTFELEEMGEALAAKLGVSYLSPVDVLCKEEEKLCLAKINQDRDSITTWDYGHLTEKSSLYIVEKVKQDLDDMISN